MIKRQINDQYGEINVIGRGESRNGLLSSTSRPDFVAVVGDRKKLVMVEVKNAKTAGAKTGQVPSHVLQHGGSEVRHNGNGGIWGALVT